MSHLPLDDFFDTLAIYSTIEHTFVAAMIVIAVLVAAYFIFD